MLNFSLLLSNQYDDLVERIIMLSKIYGFLTIFLYIIYFVVIPILVVTCLVKSCIYLKRISVNSTKTYGLLSNYLNKNNEEQCKKEFVTTVNNDKKTNKKETMDYVLHKMKRFFSFMSPIIIIFIIFLIVLLTLLYIYNYIYEAL